MPATALALYRRKKGLTQEHLSELSGVTSRTIQRIEKGAVVPHVQTLKILAACLDIEAEVLMDEPEGTPHLPIAKPASLSPLFHVAALVGLGLPILNIILPFILWLFKRDAELALAYYDALTRGTAYVEQGTKQYEEQIKRRELGALKKLAKKYNMQLVENKNAA